MDSTHVEAFILLLVPGWIYLFHARGIQIFCFYVIF